MSEQNFPQFSRLPFELRNAIWVRFALPREPMLHSISKRYQVDDLFVCSFSMRGPGIDVFLLPTTRSLMQVSYEARKAVLAGRQLQGFKLGKYNSDVFFGGVYNGAGSGQYLMLHNFFFVNWDIDMLYFRHYLHLAMGNIFDNTCLSKIKRIAIEIEGPMTRENVSYARDCMQLFTRTSFSGDMVNLPSLDTIHLALDFRFVRKSFTYTHPQSDSDADSEMGSDEHGGEDDSEDEEEPDENPEQFDDDLSSEDEYDAIELFDEISNSDNNDDYGHWISELPKDQYGFHHIGPETYRLLGEIPTCFFRRRWPLPPVEISFQNWVDKIVSRVKEDSGKFYGSTADIQMVMDVYGGISPATGGYYRGYVDLRLVSET